MNDGNGKRPAPISYRPPATLRDEFDLRVAKSGLSISAYITKCVFDKAPPRQSKRPAAEYKLLAKILGEAAKIHDNLHVLKQSQNMTNEDQLLFEAALNDLTEIRAAILKSMGRMP
jgi:hypothetical protein